jgi:hypothetical protein
MRSQKKLDQSVNGIKFIPIKKSQNTFPPGQPGGQIITIEENEQWNDILPNIDPGQNKELAYKNLTRANVLKGQRRAFYTTITKMKNRIMKATYDASPKEWRDLQAKRKETFTFLTTRIPKYPSRSKVFHKVLL